MTRSALWITLHILAIAVFVAVAATRAQAGNIAELQALWARYLEQCGPLTVDPVAHIEALPDVLGPGDLFVLSNSSVGMRSLDWNSGVSGTDTLRTTGMLVLERPDGLTYVECKMEEPLISWDSGAEAGEAFSALLAGNPQISVADGFADFLFRSGTEALAPFGIMDRPFEVLASGVFADPDILTLAQFEDGVVSVSLLMGGGG